MKIFVSYTTRNNEVSVESLIDFSNKLSSFGYVFIDVIHNDSADKQGRVIDELMTTNLLILIKSESSSTSEWVQFEIESAEKMQIPIVQFHVNEIELLTEFDIAKKMKENQEEHHRKSTFLQEYDDFNSTHEFQVHKG